jgi:HEAT repeat protein
MAFMIKAIYEMLNRQIIEWKRDKRFLLDRTRLEEVERHKGVLSLDEKSKELIFASYLRNDPASEKKWFWLDVLSKEIALDLVVRAIRDGDESVYTEGIKILAQIGTNATQLLISRLSDTDWKVRQALIEALLLCGDSGLNDLRKGLGHTDRRIRRGVVTALVRLDSH